jgi:esterase/lipase superfamily enzyme
MFLGGLSTSYPLPAVEVVAFSWPANGGGVKGVLDYRSDKRDARASVGALDRTLTRIHELLGEFNAELLKDATQAAEKRYPRNAELRDDYITRLSERGCPFTVNMMLHSMGNYLFKHVLKSSIYRGTRLTFDNVTMAAADANNENHAEWVDKVQCRGRVYITINENDRALLASRVKSGQEQLPRLGHYPHNLDSTQAVYVDFTGAPRVGRSHAYFEGSPTQNAAVKRFFRRAFNGERAEQGLDYNVQTHMHRIQRRR